MEKEAIRKAIKAQRLSKKVTIAEVAKTVGKNPTFVAAALNGNHRLTPEEAMKVGKLLDLDKEHDRRPQRFSCSHGFSQCDGSIQVSVAGNHRCLRRFVA